MLPVEDELKELGIKYHFYADDTVLYFVFGSTLVNTCLMILGL